jgi:hypothetical protein
VCSSDLPVEGFAEPYAGSSDFEEFTPTQIASTDPRVNQGIGQARADEIAAIFGLDKSKVLTPEQYSLLTSGGGVGGNLSDALLFNEAMNWFINTETNPTIVNIDGVETPIVLGSYGLMVNQNGMLQTYAQETGPGRRFNFLLGPTFLSGYLDTWFLANGATETLRMFQTSLAAIESTRWGYLSQQLADPWELAPYNTPGADPAVVYTAMPLIPPIWIWNFMAEYVVSPSLGALMPAYWTAIPEPVVTALLASPTGQVIWTDYQQYFQ